MKGRIRQIQLADAEKVLEWRNSETVRLNMYNHEIINIESHLSWFDSMLSDESCRYFIYEQDDEPLGVLSFSNIDQQNKKAFWAFYSGATSIRGIGSEMEQLALEYAFNELNLNKLCCEVLEFNNSVINFHRKFGFKIEGIKKQDYFRDGKFYDVYQLAMLKSDYIEISKYNDVQVEKRYNWDFILTRGKVDAFAELSDSRNIVKFDEDTAVKPKLGNRIEQGSLLAAEISRVAATEYPPKKSIYLSQNLKFISSVDLDKPLTGKAQLKTQIGRFVIIEYSIYQDERLVTKCESEFLLNNKDD